MQSRLTNYFELDAYKVLNILLIERLKKTSGFQVTQIYKGPMVRGLYHGLGLMIWQENNKQQIYNGYFYTSYIHGYGRMIYANGSVFEGIYKDNRRFGPGILTYVNQQQDVGFWFGNRMLRTISDVTWQLVQSFEASNTDGLIKQLQFRDLIDLTQIIPREESSQSVTQFLLTCAIQFGENIEALGRNSWTLDENELDHAEDVESAQLHKPSIFPRLLAYNNNTLDKMIMAHMFQQKFAEESIFITMNDLWEGKRDVFGSPGDQELAANYLLTELDLSPDHVQNHILDSNIEVDVADFRGNTRLMIAVANDQHDIIHCLVGLGAYLECCNDDGFTPLNMALMRYVCLLNNIKRWNEYVIPHVVLKFNVKKGSQVLVLKNKRNINFFSPENLVNLIVTDETNIMNAEKSIFKIKQSVMMKRVVYSSIEKTISILLNKGAKTTTSCTPRSSIHMALMTCNYHILESVIKAEGDVHYILTDEDYRLNLLHMAVVLPINYNVINCIKVLIKHGVDCNHKSIVISVY
ncbi:ankyrin repeat and MYND domain-containing protein 1-like isoform X4 [Adelges cooleyi]|uniref:ankyrin repeat and MYND domain-containing protein 1-like isoform X4 n=1 Tax=Adelges cooleyi TaxID=133065 RepID=UPI00217FAD03|nr:ankyrin repeat and MYND domain-containing protein 1-like isoform X4 [Adelges cooleyi]